MSHRIRVLFVFDSLSVQGAERVALQTIASLDRNRFEPVLCVLRSEGELWHAVPPDTEVHVLMQPGERIRRAVPRIVRILLGQAKRADVIVGAVELMPTYLAVTASTLTRTPSVGWVHNSMEKVFQTLPPVLNHLSRLTNARLTRVVAVSAGVAETLRRIHHVPLKRLSTIYNPHDIERLRQRRALPLPEGAAFMHHGPTILGIGRLTTQKGFDLLIEAHAILRARGSRHNLVILGEGPERSALELLRDELGVRDSVYLVGQVENPAAFLQNATVFALSSRYEGLPGVLIEALACGAPSVAFDCPSGPAEILENGRYGCLVPPGDVQAFANALEDLLGSEVQRDRLRRDGEERALAFTPERTVPRWEELLEQVAHATPAA